MFNILNTLTCPITAVANEHTYTHTHTHIYTHTHTRVCMYVHIYIYIYLYVYIYRYGESSGNDRSHKLSCTLKGPQTTHSSLTQGVQVLSDSHAV